MATATSPSDSAQSKTMINLTQADSPYSLDRNACPCIITNDGATGAVTVNLPEDCKGGETVEAVVTVAQDIILNPGSAGTIAASNGTAFSTQSAGATLIGDALGERVALASKGGDDWIATDQSVAGPANAFSQVA